MLARATATIANVTGSRTGTPKTKLAATRASAKPSSLIPMPMQPLRYLRQSSAANSNENNDFRVYDHAHKQL